MSDYLVKLGQLYADQVNWRSIGGTIEDLVDGGYDITIKPEAVYTKRAPANVKAFGAVGDGTTDDTTSIQAACNSLTTGDTLFFPPGTYRTSSEIAVPAIDAVCVCGYGALIYSYATSGSVLRLGDGVTEMKTPRIEGLKLQATQNVTSVLRLQYTSNLLVQNIILDGQATYGFLLEANWNGCLKSCGTRGEFTHLVYSHADPVSGYLNNGFVVENCWLHGQEYSGCQSGIYIEDACTKFRSVNNYYERINASGAVAINVAAGLKFLSFGDHFEQVYKIGTQTANHGRWLYVTTSSTTQNGIDLAGNGAWVDFVPSSTSPVNNFVDITGDNNTVYQPDATAWTDTGDGNRIFMNNDECWSQLSGDFRARGASSLYGYRRKHRTLTGSYTCTVNDCGRTLYTSGWSALGAVTLPNATDVEAGYYVRVVQGNEYHARVNPYDTDDSIQYLPDGRMVRLKGEGFSATFELVVSGANGIWVITECNAPLEVPLSADITLDHGCMIDRLVFTNSFVSAGAITVTLPTSEDEIGTRTGTFVRTQNTDFYIDPSGTEEFRGGGGAGKYKFLSTVGASMTIRNADNGYWEVEMTSGTVSDEP